MVFSLCAYSDKYDICKSDLSKAAKATPSPPHLTNEYTTLTEIFILKHLSLFPNNEQVRTIFFNSDLSDYLFFGDNL